MPQGRDLTFYERQRIETYLREKKSKIHIARKLLRDSSVIKREIKRNSGESGRFYNALSTQKATDVRKRSTNVRKLEKKENKPLADYKEHMLKDG